MQFIKVEQKGAVTHVVLNRPSAMNSLTMDMHHELQQAFDAFAADPQQLICVITGEGDRAFCAGSDLKAAAQGEMPISAYPDGGYGGLSRRFDCNKPFIAAVNGVALGGGFEIALACDIVIASENASFGLPEPLVGAIALGGGLHRLARQLPLKQAMGIILSSQRVSAADGLQMGFVNEVTPQAELMQTVTRWCDNILRASPVAIQASKTIVNRGLAENSVSEAIINQFSYPEYISWEASNDFAEGPKAFLEKRQPHWTGT